MLAVLRVGVTLAVATGGFMLAVLRMGVSAAAPPLQVISYQSAGGRSERTQGPSIIFYVKTDYYLVTMKNAWQCKAGKSDRHPINPKTLTPQYQPIPLRNKFKFKFKCVLLRKEIYIEHKIF